MSRFSKVLVGFISAAIGAAAWWQTHSFWKTALISIAGAVIGFGKGVWSYLEPDWTKRLASSIDRYVTTELTGYQKQYAQQLYYLHRTFDVKGFPTQGKFALELEKVYVHLDVDAAVINNIPQDPVRPTVNGIPNTGRPARSPKDVFDWLSVDPAHPRNYAVIGAPGSGKTTMLKHLALALAARQSTLKLTPILLFIRDHSATIGTSPATTLTDVIEHSLRASPPPGWFERRLIQGKCLVMFDGLDEVADPKLRLKVVEWVERQVEHFGANRFVVSSRPNGYRNNPLSGFTVLRVLPFYREQIERFVRNWYLANELVAHQKDDPGVRAEAEGGAEDLLARLRDTPTLQELAVNPLLLTLIATVHRYRNQLPGRRVELYTEICDVFLGKRQQARGIEVDLTPAQKTRVLRVLAWEMMRTERREIDTTEAAKIIADPLKLISPTSDPVTFLQLVEDSSALLNQREGGVYGFSHLSFQEYLASLHAKEEKLVTELVHHLTSTWWHETARLYAAQADATPIVEWCLADAHPKVENLLLATNCEEEALEIRQDLREKIYRYTQDAVEDSDVARRLLAAEYMLARRFRNMTRMSDDLYIDSCPVTHCEYQLFINSKLAQGLPRQPDHWKSYQFPAGSGLLPIVGIRPQDAEEFCQWLDSKRWGEWTWELPSASDLNQIMSHSSSWKGLIFYSKDGASPKPEVMPGRKIVEQVLRDVHSITASHLDHAPIGARRRIAWFSVWIQARGDAAFDRQIQEALDRAFGPVLNPNIDRVLGLVADKSFAKEIEETLDQLIDRALDPKQETIARGFRIALGKVPDRQVGRHVVRALLQSLSMQHNFAQAMRSDLDRILLQPIPSAEAGSVAKILSILRDLDEEESIKVTSTRRPGSWEHIEQRSSRDLDVIVGRTLEHICHLVRVRALVLALGGVRAFDPCFNSGLDPARVLDPARGLSEGRVFELAGTFQSQSRLDLGTALDLARVRAVEQFFDHRQDVGLGAFMLNWLCLIEKRSENEMLATESLWIGRSRFGAQVA